LLFYKKFFIKYTWDLLQFRDFLLLKAPLFIDDVVHHESWAASKRYRCFYNKHYCKLL